VSPKIPRPAGGRPDRATGIVRQEQHSLDTRSNAKSQYSLQLRRERPVERIRYTPGLMAEIARHHGISDDIDRLPAASVALDAEILAVVCGDRFPPLRKRLLGGGR
jgi:hypothetical protein